MKEQLLKMSERIFEEQNVLCDLKVELNNLISLRDEKELNTYVDVTYRKTADGKAMYSNEKLREFAIKEDLSKDADYKILKNKILELQKAISLQTNKIEFIKRNLEIMLYVNSIQESKE